MNMKFSDLSPKFQKEAISTIIQRIKEHVDEAVEEYKAEHGELPEWAATEELKRKEYENYFESYFNDIKDNEGYFSVETDEYGNERLEC